MNAAEPPAADRVRQQHPVVPDGPTGGGRGHPPSGGKLEYWHDPQLLRPPPQRLAVVRPGRARRRRHRLSRRGNEKGAFTRDRQPKAVAHLLGEGGQGMKTS
ncbi:hypothetical protein GCM10027418_20060 [Mariniluteicoccus endophyticus]